MTKFAQRNLCTCRQNNVQLEFWNVVSTRPGVIDLHCNVLPTIYDNNQDINDANIK